MASIENIPVEKIEDPEILLHPNPDLEGLRELAESIKQTGQHQEIVVRKVNGKYKLIIGYRRVRAAKTFGIPTLRARVVDLDSKDALMATATENIQRIESDPLKEGELYQKLLETHNMTEAEISRKFGKSPGYIKSRLKLLGLSEPVQELLKNKVIQLGVATEVAKIQNPQDQMIVALDLKESPQTVNRAKAIVSSFIEFREHMEEAPPEEAMKKAREEPLIQCFFCKENKPLSAVKGYNMCDTCYHGTVYLFEQERREKLKA